MSPSRGGPARSLRYQPLKPRLRNQDLSGGTCLPLISTRTGGRLAKCASHGRNLRPILTVGAAGEPEGKTPSDRVRVIGSRNRPARHRYPWRSEGRADEGDEGTTRGHVGGAREICSRGLYASASAHAAHPSGGLSLRKSASKGAPVGNHTCGCQRLRRLLPSAGPLDLFHYRN